MMVEPLGQRLAWVAHSNNHDLDNEDCLHNLVQLQDFHCACRNILDLVCNHCFGRDDEKVLTTGMGLKSYWPTKEEIQSKR